MTNSIMYPKALCQLLRPPSYQDLKQLHPKLHAAGAWLTEASTAFAESSEEKVIDIRSFLEGLGLSGGSFVVAARPHERH